MVSLLLFSCQEEKIELYNAGHYVQFTTADKDTANISFFLYPKLEEIKVPLEVRLIGKMPEAGLNYRIEVVKNETDAPADCYSLPSSFTFKAGQPLDTAFITFYKKPELKTEKKKITLQILASDEVLPGQTNYTKRTFYVSDIISKPAWWNDRITNYMLGKYSDKKYRLFIEITGEGELGKYSEYIQRNYILQFKYYLIMKKNEGDPVLDDDGSDMLSTVPILG